jgi:hypothetical protein
MSELMEAARSAAHTPEANAKRAASRAKTMAAKKRAAKKAAKKEKPHDIPLSALRHLAPKTKKRVKSKKRQAKQKHGVHDVTKPKAKDVWASAERLNQAWADREVYGLALEIVKLGALLLTKLESKERM